MARGAKSNRYKKQKSMKKQLVTTGNVNFNMPSSSRNSFSILAEMNDMDTNPETNITEVKQHKPPPIVVDSNIPFVDIRRLLGQDCIYKRTSIGTKVFPPNNEKSDLCKKLLIDGKIEFHSFNSKENRLYTTFLYGLPKISTVDIVNELKNYNLIPSSVVEINTKFSTNNNAVYKVQFTRKSFNPSSLKNVKTITNIIITWKKHKPKNNKTPTQCWNCLMFGHGGEHCNRRPACMICANQHHTNECPFTTNDKRPAVFSCFNCKKHGKERFDHSANDVNCPLRSLYLETRERATTKNSQRFGKHQLNNNFQYNTADFPAVNNQTNNNNTNYSYRPNMSVSYANQLKSNNDLFTVDELFNIFTAAMEDLQRCSSKVQQIKIVMSMLKYAHGLH